MNVTFQYNYFDYINQVSNVYLHIYLLLAVSLLSLFSLTYFLKKNILLHIFINLLILLFIPFYMGKIVNHIYFLISITNDGIITLQLVNLLNYLSMVYLVSLVIVTIPFILSMILYILDIVKPLFSKK